MSYEAWPTAKIQNSSSIAGRPMGCIGPIGQIEPAKNDPIHQFLVRKKQQGEDNKLPEIQSFPEDDVKALESFCNEHGIFGFNFGRMHPKAALKMLKSKMGMPDYTEAITVTQVKKLIQG